jgi:hypothetical protein
MHMAAAAATGAEEAEADGIDGAGPLLNADEEEQDEDDGEAPPFVVAPTVPVFAGVPRCTSASEKSSSRGCRTTTQSIRSGDTSMMS